MFLGMHTLDTSVETEPKTSYVCLGCLASTALWCIMGEGTEMQPYRTRMLLPQDLCSTAMLHSTAMDSPTSLLIRRVSDAAVEQGYFIWLAHAVFVKVNCGRLQCLAHWPEGLIELVLVTARSCSSMERR